jgi:ribose transport system permease protein
MYSYKNKIFNILIEYKLIIALFVVVVFFTSFNRSFLSVTSIYVVLLNMSIIGLICVGQTLVKISSGLDLSVGSVSLLSGIVSAYLITNYGFNVWVSLIVVILMGATIGILNGILISKVKINPILATFSTFSILFGLARLISKGYFINVSDPQFRILGIYRIFGFRFLQLPIIFMIIIFILFGIVLKRTLFGRYVYAIGGDKQSARLAGIKVDLIETIVYMINGSLSSLTGFIFASRVGSATPDGGENYSLISIAVVMLGGASLKGGKGSILNTFIALLLLQSLLMGLRGSGFQTYIQDIATGGLLIGAVLLDRYNQQNIKT